MKLTTARRIEALADVRRRFLAEGFLPGAPAGLNPAALEIDQQATRSYRCLRKGMNFHPFRHRDGNGYRVALACPACNAAEEF